MMTFLRWFIVGAVLSAVCMAGYIALEMRRLMHSTPGIGAVSFSLESLLTWIVMGGMAVAIVATSVARWVMYRRG